MEFLCFQQYGIKKPTNLKKIHKNHEIFEKTRNINAIKFNSFKRRPKNALNDASLRQQERISLISQQ